ncbi:MAG TPA: NIPSNAP family protein [Vicinamibacteria bacterium]|nr:NIPSNAP family protein [Vicinamibacteria bacterium]
MMSRRDFVAASLGASLSPTMGQAAAREGTQGTLKPKAVAAVLELRRYRFRFGPMEARFAEYAKNVLVPALNRAGVKPVGAFSVVIGPDNPVVYLLLPHPGPESVPTLAGRLGADPEYQHGAAAFRGLPANDPPYVRRESSLMVPFDSVPAVEIPTGAVAVPSRLFELRIYESHNESANLKKIEMFERAGEIDLFRRVGLTPVFFARNVIGPALPSLTYMLAFADAAAREKNWAVFREDPAWVKLRSTPGFTNAEILSNINNVLLRPTDYSQI